MAARRNMLIMITVALFVILLTGCDYANGAPVSGVVAQVDAAHRHVILDTAFGPLTVTLNPNGYVERLPLPNDALNTKQGQINLAAIPLGSTAVVTLTVAQLQEVVNEFKAPSKGNDAAKNNETFLKRSLGLLDGYATATDHLRIQPAPFNIAQSDANQLGLRAIPASFGQLDPDGSFTALITKYGYVRVVSSPATRFDRLGVPITARDLKNGDNLLLYGAPVWVGFGKAGDGSDLPIVYHIAALHVVTQNEQIVSGILQRADDKLGILQLVSETGSITITTTPATRYQSLVAGLRVEQIGTLKVGQHIVAYTLADSDTDPHNYVAFTIYVTP